MAAESTMIEDGRVLIQSDVLYDFLIDPMLA